MKKLLVLGVMLLSSVAAQAVVAMADMNQPVGGYRMGQSRPNQQSQQDIRAINALFYGGKAPARVLPYLTLDRQFNVLRYYPNNGSNPMAWPHVRIGIDCLAGYIGYDQQTNKFTCYKYPAKATSASRRAAGSSMSNYGR